MSNRIWNNRIPTLLGIGIITIGIAITSFLVKSGVIFMGHAQPTETPQNLTITNISDTSFTVSYLTKDNVAGSVNFGKDKNLGQLASDERDEKLGSATPHKVHSITIKNLTPKTQYFFSISSGQKTFLNDTIPFEVSTAPTLKTQPLSQMLLRGQVIMPNGERLTEGIVYATTENAQVISTLVADGGYILLLNPTRTADLSSYFNFGETIVKMLIANDTLKSSVSISGKQDTLPTITLSNNYDFTESTTPIATESAEFIGFPSISVTEASGSASSPPKIILPKKNQELSDQQPQFSGTAIPNEKVQIIIHSPGDLEAEVTADAFGNWKYRPSNPLTPGQHTITIIARDAQGVLKTITQSFVVFAAGTQVSQSATPSATPTLAFPKSPTPTPKTPTPLTSPTPIASIPTPTPTRIPSPTPTTAKTLALAPTLTPTPLPTSILTPTLTPTPTLTTPSLTKTTTSTSTSTPTPTLCPGCPTPTPNPLLSLSRTPIASITPVVTISPPGDSSALTVGIIGVAIAAIGLLLFLLTHVGT